MTYFPYGTLAIPRHAIMAPAVGTMILESPSPSLKASTATCRVIPVRSEIGTMIGITATACPEPEEISKLKQRLKRNIIPAPMILPTAAIGMVR